MSRVCLEATGQYHLALALDDAGLARMVITPRPPNASRGHADPHQDRSVDAAVLAQFAQRMPFTSWQRPDDLALAIRAYARHSAALNKLRTQTKNQLHTAQQTTTTPDFLIASRHQSIAHFDAQIEYLRRQVLDLIIAANEALQQSFKLLVSATGIAANRYLQIALYLPAFSAARHDPNVRAFYRHLIDTRGLKKL